MSKRIISICLTILMMLTLLPMATFAEELNAPKFEIDSVDATPGDTVSVNISLKNNPGFVTAGITLAFDEGLTLVGATNGNTFPASMQFTVPKQLTTVGEITGSCNFAWTGMDIADSDIKDGVILTLRFRVSDDAEIGDVYNITVSARRSDFVDKNLQTVEMQTVQGKVTVIDYTPGDVNDDGEISLLDTVMISRYVVDNCTYDPNGYAIRLNEQAADVNDDGSISLLDTVMISRYIVDDCKTDPNGYNITLKPSKKKCQHEMQAFEAKAATCIDDGNEAYWYCGLCDKFFSDVNGSHVITLEDTVIAATGHTVVIDPAVPATYESTGLTEGSHCGTCGYVIVGQEVIPPIDPNEVPEGCYRIYYYLYDGQSYLEATGVNNPNPLYYDPAVGLSLKNLSNPNYIFNGWYDSEGGADSTRVRNIPKGSEGEFEVYARWTPRTYNVTLDYDFNQEVHDTYTFGETYRLPISPAKDGYQFISWTDKEDGSVQTTIPIGTSGDKYYYANWLSNRNQAWTKKTLGAPLITETDDKVLFAYEIGEIRNVPLDVIKDFGYTMESGVKMEVDESYSATTSKTQMDSLASTISKSTTDSFAWTLSSDWSKCVTVDQEWAEQNNMTDEKIEKQCKSETDSWYSSKTSFSSTDTEVLGSTETHNLKTTNDNTKTYDTTDQTDNWKNSAELSAEISQHSKVGVPGVEVGYDVKVGGKLAGEYGNTTLAKTGTEKDKGELGETGDIQMSGSNTTIHGGFNSESGRSASKTVSEETEVRKAVSKMVAKNDHYGEQYIDAGGSSENQGFSENNSTSDEVVSSVTYSTQTSRETTVKYTLNNTNSGCHRYILAGTAHVYGVVGYDIANQCYFTYSFTVMDDERHMMEDYSPKPGDGYHDHEFSGITFDVPIEIADYVDNMIGATEGLEINTNGIVTRYTGDSQIVIVPKYISYRNADNTRTAIKVVGIRDDAFQGTNKTNIGAIQLPDTVTKIPARAFEGCTSLLYVEAPGVTEIGEAAYAGCTSLHVCFIDEKITKLGNAVFDGMSEVYVKASKADIATAAVNSGVSEIYLTVPESCNDLNNIELTVPDTVTKFEFNGGGKTFTNLRIESNAAETLINNAIFVSDGRSPLQISSSNVRLGQVNIDAVGVGLVLSAPETEVELYGESSVSSTSGKAVLCRSTEFRRASDSVNTTELTIADGNILRCGALTANNLIKDYDGKNLPSSRIEEISEEDFANYLRGVITLTFDPNGGTIAQAESTKMCVYGTYVGDCPIPTKDYNRFVGWYTEPTGGTLVNETTPVTSASDIIVYAHWVDKDVLGWIKASELPEGSQVVDTKWSYTLRSYKESASSSLTGWIHYDTQRTSWGATQGPVNSNPQNGVRNVWSEQYVSSKTTHYKYYHRCSGTGYWGSDSTAPGWTRHNIDLTYQLTFYETGSYNIAWYKGYACPQCGEKYRWIQDGTYTTNNYSTRWYYQEPIYTYYYYQDNDLESETDPTGLANVSNVQQWVLYREK